MTLYQTMTSQIRLHI